MKIYINNFNIDILPSIIKSFTEYYINSETYIQIYSEDGVFQINDTSTKKQNITDKDIQIFKEYYENFTLIADPSYYTLEETYNIPSEHLSTTVKRCFFTPDKNSIFKLVIEGNILEENNKNNKDSMYGIHPYDIYIEVEGEIVGKIPVKDIKKKVERLIFNANDIVFGDIIDVKEYVEVDKDKYQNRNNQDRNKKDPNTEKKDQNKNDQNTDLNLNDELVKQEIIVFLSLLN